MFQVMNKGK